MLKRTKIGATIGPACSDIQTLEKMVKAGMNFARLNFSHGSYESHTELINNIRTVEKKTGQRLPILQDLQGPKMRLGALPPEGVELLKGTEILFDTALREYAGLALPITFVGLEKHLKIGERLLVDDGHMEVKITTIDGSVLTGLVIEGGTALAHKGLNFPDSALTGIPALSEKDKADVAFGVESGVDIISLSFTKRPEDILELRSLIKECELRLGTAQKPIAVVGKIERPEAVKNIEAIMRVADLIMVARGDLGLEMPEEELPITQKTLIRAANQAGKAVIVATQLLDSMQHSRRPSRAEVSDVANAVIDGVDALLLTNETATGEFPVEAVETLCAIIVETEKSSYDDSVHPATEKQSGLLS